jgi:hypothetical protein
MKTEIKVGEYTVIHENGTNFHALRHGEQWRDLTGDNLVLALVSRIEQLEKLWTEPTKDMVNAGLGEVQRIAEEWDESWDFDLAEISDDQASDMAVFTLQAMASKLPKEPD